MLLTKANIATLDALLAVLVPTEPDAPGAEEVGLTDYLLHELAGDLSEHLPLYQLSLAALEVESRARYMGSSFDQIAHAQQVELLRKVETGDTCAHEWADVGAMRFVKIVAEHAAEGFYIHPLAWQPMGFEVTA